MSDSEDSDNNAQTDFLNIHDEIERCKKNPETSEMFVSGWDDADEGVNAVSNPQENPISHILWAAENGEEAVVRELLINHPGLVHARDEDGYTPLHRAAYGNHLLAMSHLLSFGANVSSKTEMGWTPLHSACKWNNYICAARLIAAGANPMALSDGDQTPLHLASAISHCKSTLLILLLREDIVEAVKKANKSGETPEQLAKGHGVYAPLFEMSQPATTYIHSIAFTCNPYVRAQLENK